MNSSSSAGPAATLSISGENRIDIQGVLTFDSLPRVMEQAEKIFSQLQAATVSFAGVSGTRSAGLALVLEMVRYMKLQNKTIRFQDLPEPINSDARNYGIDTAIDAHPDTRDLISV